jgi:hypothetical protein
VTLSKDTTATYRYWGKVCELSGGRKTLVPRTIVATEEINAQCAENRRVANALKQINVDVGVDPNAAIIAQGIADYLEAEASLIEWRNSATVRTGLIVKGGINPGDNTESDRVKEVEQQAVQLRTQVLKTQAELQNRYRVVFGKLYFLGEGSASTDAAPLAPIPPNVVATDKGYVPAPGYGWVTTGSDDMRVKWNPEGAHPTVPNVVASDKEGKWKPADGYKWANDTNDDLSVVPDG